MMMVIIKGEINLEQKEMDMEMEVGLPEGNGGMIVDQVVCLHQVEEEQVQVGAEEETVEK